MNTPLRAGHGIRKLPNSELSTNCDDTRAVDPAADRVSARIDVAREAVGSHGGLTDVAAAASDLLRKHENEIAVSMQEWIDIVRALVEMANVDVSRLRFGRRQDGES